ncbi:unnamed protein product, partial [Ceratitis capitata]
MTTRSPPAQKIKEHESSNATHAIEAQNNARNPSVQSAGEVALPSSSLPTPHHFHPQLPTPLSVTTNVSTVQLPLPPQTATSYPPYSNNRYSSPLCTSVANGSSAATTTSSMYTNSFVPIHEPYFNNLSSTLPNAANTSSIHLQPQSHRRKLLDLP